MNHRYGPIVTAVAQYNDPETNTTRSFYEWDTEDVPVLHSKLIELQSKSRRVRYTIIRLVKLIARRYKKEEGDLFSFIQGMIKNQSTHAANPEMKNILNDIGTVYFLDIAQPVQRLLEGGERLIL